MKVDGNGQGKILSQDELRRLFTEGFLTPRDRALFGICLFTGCRVSEALSSQYRSSPEIIYRFYFPYDVISRRPNHTLDIE